MLGRVALVWGDSAAAASWSQRAIEWQRSMHRGEAAFDFALETLARISLADGDAATASVWLDSVGRGPDPWWFEGAFVSAVRCFRVSADEQRAGRLLRYVHDQPRATFEARMAAAWACDSGVGGLADGVDDGVEGVRGVAADVMASLAADTD